MCCKVQHASKFTAAKSPHAFFAQHDPTGSPQFPHGYQHLVFPNDFPPQFIVAASAFRAFLRPACPTIELSEVLAAEERRYAKDEKSVGAGLGPDPIPADGADPAQPHAAAPSILIPAAFRNWPGSIRQYGVLQPLTVRKAGGAYELVAGERRLRAARLAGLTEVPCLLADVDEEASGMLALVENLQRRDLDYIEEAEGLQKLMQQYHLSQEQAARRIGKSQSAVANKLRILAPSAVRFGRRCAKII